MTVLTLDEARKKRYGIWSGNPKGRPYVEGNCCNTRKDPGGYISRQCNRKNGYGPSNLYCKVCAKQFKRMVVTTLPNKEILYCIPNHLAIEALESNSLSTLCGIEGHHIKRFYSSSKINCPRCLKSYKVIQLYTLSNFNDTLIGD